MRLKLAYQSFAYVTMKINMYICMTLLCMYV